MKTVRLIVIILLFIVGINAIVAGYLFIVDPTGCKLGMTPQVLKHSPFNDFLIPGIVLFIVNGVMNIITAFLVLFKTKIYQEAVLLQAILLVGWIIIQMMMLQTTSFLHYTFIGVGLALFMSGAYLKIKESTYLF